jgi:proline racemase
MKYIEDLQQVVASFAEPTVSLDSHTGGEMTRLLLTGARTIEGATMLDKLNYFRHHHDDLRLRLSREPRGHRGVVMAALTEPVSANADFGLLYMDARRYIYLCGHATIGAVASLYAAGMLALEEDETELYIDTPSGLMTARARVGQGRLQAVTITMVPSFVFATCQRLEVEGFGPLDVDLVCTGGFFAMVRSDQVGLEPTAENADKLADLGMRIIAAANEQLQVSHPLRSEVKSVDVVEYYQHLPEEQYQGRGLVVYGEGKVDRSPCGTGTAAKLTLLHQLGEIEPEQPYLNYSPLLTRFAARIVAVTTVGPYPAVVVEITGMAQVTGVHAFLLSEDDPFPQGFLL